MMPDIRGRAHRALWAAVLLALASCGGDADLKVSSPATCGGGGGPQVNGTVRMPDGRVAQAPSAWDRVVAMLAVRAGALTGDASPVGAGVEVQLVELRQEDVIRHRQPGVIATAATDQYGDYCMRLVTDTDQNVCRYVLQVGNADDGTLTRAFVFATDEPIDIDYRSEAAVRVILAEIPPADLCSFSPDEIRAIYEEIVSAPGEATGADAAEMNAVAASLAAADPGVASAVDTALQAAPTATPDSRTPTPTPTGMRPTRTPRTHTPTFTATVRPTETRTPAASTTVAPSNTPAPSSTPLPATPTVVRTNTPPATNTAVRTNTPPPATNTAVRTNTPPPPTNTAVRTNTPPPPTNTAVRTNTPPPPTNTAVRTNTPVPATATGTPTLPAPTATVPATPPTPGQGLGERVFTIREDSQFPGDNPRSGFFSSGLIGKSVSDRFTSGPLTLVAGEPGPDGIAPVSLKSDVYFLANIPGANLQLCFQLLAEGSSGSIDCNGGTASSVRREQATGADPPPSTFVLNLGSDSGPGALVLKVRLASAEQDPGSDCSAAATFPEAEEVYFTSATAAGLKGSKFLSRPAENFSCANWTTTDGAGMLAVAVLGYDSRAGGDVVNILRIADM